MPRYQKPVLNFVADDVWAAACQAQRTNGSYVKYAIQDQEVKTNRQIVEELMADTTLITDEDREQGQLVRKHYQAFTFKILQGIKLNEFTNNAMLISNRDIINDNFDVAVITSLPSCYEREVKRITVDQKVRFATGGYISTIGQKVSLLKLEVIRIFWSVKYNIYFVTGITPNDEAVFFSYKNEIPVGTNIVVNGTVKAHRDNSTQLNRVKVL